MSLIDVRPESLRAARLRAWIPRAVLYFVLGTLCVAGVRAIVEGPPAPIVTPVRSTPAADQGVRSFAEAFTHAYLAWDARKPELREAALAPYVSESLDANGGLQPAGKTRQSVRWTTVLGTRHTATRDLVTVAAETTTGLVYLSVPVSRDRRGFLIVSGYPALVGAPAPAKRFVIEPEEAVDDLALRTVVERAVRNYLGRANGNLLADLTPGAVISLPPQTLTIENVVEIAWAERPKRVALTARAKDDRGDTWTLRYEVDVVKQDRWYVQRLQVDPTFQGGR
jgi:hypothetical protein